MVYIDTHAHICKTYDENDPSIIIAEALKENVGKIINVGTDVDTSKEIIEVAKNHPTVYAAIGIHPTDCWSELEIEKLRSLILPENKVVAIGEIGLDYYHLGRNKAPKREIQQLCFKKMLDLALEFNLPVLVHCRDALEDLYQILSNERYRNLRGVLHTFAGNYIQANKFIELGFYISFSGIVTFKNAPITKEVATKIPLERIMAETDTPFLTPMPFRGYKNHTKNVQYVYREIAKLRGEPIAIVINQIEENVKTLFGI